MRFKYRYRFFIITLFILSLISVHATVIDSKLSMIAPIFNSCLGCHSSPSSTQLGHATTLAWINSGLITPGDSNNSRLLTAITSNKPGAMISVSVSEANLTSIKEWINQVQILCTLPYSNINLKKNDGCGCTPNYDEIRNKLGTLTQCVSHPTTSCTINYSQVNDSKPDKCGCIPGHNEMRDSLKKLTACNQPTFTFDPELKRYNRCHGQFTRSAITLNDPRVELIKAKKLTGTKACMELLNKANLTSEGKIKTDPSGKYDLEGMQILSTFQKLHMSWFTNHNWSDVAANQHAFYRGTEDLFYTGESALLITRALFLKDIPYSSLVTSPNAYEAIRLNPTNSVFTFSGFNSYEYLTTATQHQVWTPPERIEVGNIIGIKQMEPGQIPYLFDVQATNAEYKIPIGGGVLGSNTFFMLNQGRELHAKTDGGLATYRRWSKYIYRDVLCREIPVIRSLDALNLPKILPSTLTFRNGNSCRQCHFSIDGLAGAIRNRTMANTGKDDFTNKNLLNVNTLAVHDYPVTGAAETTLDKVDHDPNFYKRPPLANLIFRQHNGNLINKQYEGVEELGRAISNLDDPYICAASRYYLFLTGINVEIRDFDDPIFPGDDTSDEIKYRNIVIGLGKNLKVHQNLNKLIEDIIGSIIYITPGKSN